MRPASERRRLLGVYPSQFRAVHVRLLPGSTTLAVNTALLLLILGAAPLFVRAMPNKLKVRWGLGLLLIYPLVAFVLFKGGLFGLRIVDTSRWGGITAHT